MAIPPILELLQVTRVHGARTTVEGASFALMPGRIACLLGPSGCGKSTLLRMIAGLEPVNAGEIRVHGAPLSSPDRTVAPEDRGVGLVFQDNALFPHLNVSDNIGFGLAGMSAEVRCERVATLLDRFYIAHLARAWPHTLSGGEQQRVAIARALAREPSLLLLDEPFSGLDGQLRNDVRRSLLADLRDAGATVLIVTHDPEEAMMIADDLILMSDGRILQSGAPNDCYARPVSVAAARLLGDAIVVPATISDGTAQTPLGPVPAPGHPDGPAELAVRPEKLYFAAEGAAAEILSGRCIGNGWLIDLVVGDTQLTLRTAAPPPPGKTASLAIDATDIAILPLPHA
ncbi:MAG: ABC transporter ATP-binding protein [Sphingopyxis sp.]|uniref:ABC transporter ATP-binding protein n=1 Tax=Sphingopyxis sp. TaxID=1908224 RepID=UPI002ABA1CE4|nr:ABC transporter ATP-binding protein [Sphingopyxis sp.]MDZ3832674.1 ABC transporter ATP-binding protein [Sphingopyxis sp.]